MAGGYRKKERGDHEVSRERKFPTRKELRLGLEPFKNVGSNPFRE